MFQNGMRVLVAGRTVRDEGEDANENERVTLKLEATARGHPAVPRRRRDAERQARRRAVVAVLYSRRGRL
ncbi:single-stranded DNA-binding protein [compost metagenome]